VHLHLHLQACACPIGMRLVCTIMIVISIWAQEDSSALACLPHHTHRRHLATVQVYLEDGASSRGQPGSGVDPQAGPPNHRRERRPNFRAWPSVHRSPAVRFSTHPHSRQLPPSILSHLAPFLHLRECTCDAHGENLLWGHSKRTLTCSHHRSLFDRAHLLPTRLPTHPSTTCHDMPSAAALPHHLHQNRLSSRSGSVGPVLLPAPRYSSVSSSPCVPRPRSLPERQILDLGTRWHGSDGRGPSFLPRKPDHPRLPSSWPSSASIQPRRSL
jgi:hypothetical protein